MLSLSAACIRTHAAGLWADPFCSIYIANSVSLFCAEIFDTEIKPANIMAIKILCLKNTNLSFIFNLLIVIHLNLK